VVVKGVSGAGRATGHPSPTPTPSSPPRLVPDKSHTCERSRNATGSLSGADRSTARDAALWSAADVEARMEFSLASAYAHGTAALRTHLINMTPAQVALTWPAFARVRDRWAGRVELQGVSLVALSHFRDADAAAALADTVAAHGGILGAAVCCAENGGDPDDDWTTCDGDRDALLDRAFSLAAARSLDLDFHVDENGNRAATGLVDVARAALRCGFRGRVVCGHACSLAALPAPALATALAVVREAGVTVVSLPLVNEWTQDRDPAGRRAPRWRGVPPLLEVAAAGVRVALASDNVRDQFYAYGDYDLLAVLARATSIAHLDAPHGAWPAAVTRTPADAMSLPHLGRLAPSLPAHFVAFRARAFSELFARPQSDRVVVRAGLAIAAELPEYDSLDAASSLAPPRGFGAPSGGYAGRLSPAPSLANGGGLPGLPRGLEGGVTTDARALRRLPAVDEAGAPPRAPRAALAAAAAVGAAAGAAAAVVCMRARSGKWG